jgi:formylglycine-generating enzyme required for sulfatase activity
LAGFFAVIVAFVPGVVVAELATVPVAGGTLPAASVLGAVAVAPFRIGPRETTWGEWKAVSEWAAANGYDIGGTGRGVTDAHPVQSVNWFDVVKWCNAASERDGLAPVYLVDGTAYKRGEEIPAVNPDADGYRLPVETEWEWAARGGKKSRGSIYSGSNLINAVAWYYGNSSGESKPVGTKDPNELGLHDMSGNVWEWCWDAPSAAVACRRVRGGSWFYFAAYCEVAYRGLSSHQSRRDNYIGFRVARRAGPAP